MSNNRQTVSRAKVWVANVRLEYADGLVIEPGEQIPADRQEKWLLKSGKATVETGGVG